MTTRLCLDRLRAGVPTPEDDIEVADFFDGAAKAAFPVFVGDRPGAAWVHRGQVKVAFDFTVVDGVMRRIEFRADPEILERVRAREDDAAR